MMAACMLLVCRADAFALNSSLDVSQYAYTSWKFSEGFSEGTIQSRRQQREGDLGLAGMRERAAIVRGRLEVRSTIGSGTEIELWVPAATAYDASTRATSWFRVFGKNKPSRVTKV